MKKLIVLFAVAVCLTFVGHTQTPQELYKSSKVTWFGIDYTRIRLVGHGFHFVGLDNSNIGLVGTERFSNPERIVHTYFGAWNNFVHKEPLVYDVAKYLIKEDIRINLSYSEKKNEAINPNELRERKIKKVSAQEVNEIIKGYDFGTTEGIGAMLIAEYYDEKSARGSYVFVVFDVLSKSVLHMRRYITNAWGFGLRNYWARTFYNTLNEIYPDMKKWLKGRKIID